MKKNAKMATASFVLAEASHADGVFCWTRTGMLKAIRRAKVATAVGQHGVITIRQTLDGQGRQRYTMRFNRSLMTIRCREGLVAREVATVLKHWWDTMTNGGIPQ